jgi:DNA (cytosine-5)-methyltransferase 1
MRILNLYANIGGNRKPWGDEHDITAVELDPKIAALYSKLYPQDKVVVGDAHEYLLKHFHEFDFIWTSPPCPTHSRINLANGLNPYKDNTKQKENGGGIAIRYPDMKLYEEIILLKTWHRGLWCVENVVGYYEPLIPPTHFGSHYFWTNFYFPTHGVTRINRGIGGKTEPKLEELAKMKGFDLEDLRGFGIDIRLALRDITESDLAEHIFKYVLNPYEANAKLFK